MLYILQVVQRFCYNIVQTQCKIKLTQMSQMHRISYFVFRRPKSYSQNKQIIFPNFIHRFLQTQKNSRHNSAPKATSPHLKSTPHLTPDLQDYHMSSSIQTITSSVFLLSLPKQNENQPRAKQKQTLGSQNSQKHIYCNTSMKDNMHCCMFSL